jgi:long-chain acyl-CoA synthetase
MGGAASCVAGGVANAIDSFQRVENPWMKKVREAGTTTVDVERGDGYIVRRSLSAKDMSRAQIAEKFTSDKSMPLILKAACAKHAAKNALGFRKIVREYKDKLEEGGKVKDWTFIELGQTQFVTYQQLWEKIVGAANGMKVLGLGRGSRVAIYEETCANWLVMCYAIWCIGATPVTVYANLGEDALVYALREAEVDAVFVNNKQVDKLIKLCTAANIRLKAIIENDAEPNSARAVPAGSELRIHVLERVIESGLNQPEPNEMSVEPSDLALIMYTSGTTGDPKGVMLTQGNVMTAVKGLNMRLQEFLFLAEEPTYCAYLPLAHILEFCAENIMLMNGFMLGYGNPRTLTNTSAKPHGDLQEFKPVFFAGVPRIFDTIRKAVDSKLPPAGTVKRSVFDRAFAERQEALNRGLDTPFFTNRVFGPLSAVLGGRCKYIISGGAPLSAKTQEWMNIIFGAYCGQGYGLTETGAACTVQDYYHYKFENAGKLLQCCEVKLRTVDDFKVTDELPRGEILIRGPSVAQGYYKQPKQTAEAFLPDGFFATGDVGQFQPDGTLKIVGRTKALAKNSHGEYIAMEALESTYVQDPLLVPNGLCIVVDSLQPFIVAVALTDEAKCHKFCEANKIEYKWPEVLSTPEFIKAALASLAATAKANKIAPFCFIKNVRFVTDEWTPESGILTAAMKLKRREISSKYGELITKMFAESQ